jgi:hypothetical protein
MHARTFHHLISIYFLASFLFFPARVIVKRQKYDVGAVLYIPYISY